LRNLGVKYGENFLPPQGFGFMHFTRLPTLSKWLLSLQYFQKGWQPLPSLYLMTNEPNPEECDATDDAQRTERWQPNNPFTNILCKKWFKIS